MAKVAIKLNEDATIQESFGVQVSGKKGEQIELNETQAKWEVDAGRATYVKEPKEAAK